MPPANPHPARLAVIDPYVIAHVMEHPARGNRWSVREFAAVVGCSPALIGQLRNKPRHHISADLATRIAEAVGVETAVLFAPALSTDSDTTRSAA